MRNNIIVPSVLGLFMAFFTCSIHATDTTDAFTNRTTSSLWAENAPVIDGNLSDNCWKNADFSGDFKRYDEPGRGSPARVETQFAIANDAEYLYVAVEMRGEDPSKMLRSITRRDDDLDKDDTVCLYMDTFNDLRSAYFFQINSIGTQRDLYSTANGSQVDIGWDGVWDAAAKMLSDGWTAEFRIPFKILRLNWSENMTFGFDVVRFSQQRESTSEWGYTDLNQQSTLDPRQYGRITNITGVEKPIMLQIIGSGVGSVKRTNHSVFPPPDQTGWDSEEDIDGGIDLFWGITPTLTLNATINPDFAQIEADPDQLNLNGEELFLAERRPFFRENSAIFLVPDGEHPFYSRRIFDIDQGLRLTGQAFGQDIAALVVNGEDGSGEDDLFGVFRTQSALTEDCILSTWLIAKHNMDDLENFTNSHGEFYDRIDDDTNFLAGIDASYRPGNWLFNMHLYHTSYPDEMRAWYTDEATDEREKIHFKIRYYGNEWMTMLDYTDMAFGYFPELGFTNTSRMGNRIATQYFWAEKTFPENHLLNEIGINAHYLIGYPRNDSSHWSVMGGNTNMYLEFDNQISFSVTGELYDDRSFYKFHAFNTDENGQIINRTARYYANTLGRGNNDVQTVNLNAGWTDGGFKGIGAGYFGGQYYFSKVRQWNLWANWSYGQAFTAELDLDHLERYEPTEEYLAANGGWTDWDVWIYRAKFMYYFNRDLHVRTIVSGYMDEDRRFNNHGVSAMVAWEYLPGSKLYCVYESNWIPYDFETEELLGVPDWQHGQDVFYFKLSYMLNL